MTYFMTTSYTNIPCINEDDYWNLEWGDVVKDFIDPIDKGLRVDARFFPPSGFLELNAAKIPCLFSIQFWYCNDVIKQAIERLEPGRHHFSPYRLRSSREGVEIAQLYIINIVDPLDAVDRQKSNNLTYFQRRDGVESFVISPLKLSKDRTDIALNPDLIEGRHLWIGPGAFGPGNAFVSDELHDVIKRHLSSPAPIDFYKTK